MLHGNELVMTQAQAKQLDEGIAMMKANMPEIGSTQGLRNATASIQGAVNTLRSPASQASAGPGIEGSMQKLQDAFQAMGEGNLAAMKAALDPEMFKGMKDAMEKTASGIGSQLVEQKNMTKVTKNLGNMGNVFSRGGLNI